VRISTSVALLLVLFALSASANAEPVDFNRDIRPILSDNCFQCHGPDPASREADLRLDVEEAAKADLGDYAAIVPGDSAASEMMRRATTHDESEQMPPAESGKSLTSHEIELLKRWIAEGATWSPAWSYVAPQQREPPAVADESWVRNWIDPFVLARLEAEKIRPAAEADAVTLVRRLSFDLTGLPPKRELVEEFLAVDGEGAREEAYERLVDRLLASPHFGERMAMYWLDLVRFADTVGYHGDQGHRIWPYRDYVIHAFNENMPFDQFTREQLAGDLLSEPTVDQIVATGYNRVLQTTHEGGLQLKEYRAIYMADRVRNFSQVWMGATMGCCQCHDHKYDPYTTRDFYSMGAFFADIDEEYHLRHEDAEKLDKLTAFRKPEMEVLGIYQREQIAEMNRQIAVAKQAGNSESVTELTKQRDALAEKKSPTMITKATTPRVVRVLARGNWMDETGPIVEPSIPGFLGQIETAGERATRLDLANWLTDTEQGVGGLTARVMANRFWYLLFGEGLARVLDDFGGQGEPPSHPELLDHLATEFLASDWDVKHMMKLIVMSSAYRQTTRVATEQREDDPLNVLISHQARFRLPAEMVRDTALSVSGLLNSDIGGRSVKPYQPAGLYQHLNFPKREYEADTGPELWRRSVYMHWQRQYLHPMLKALDAPSREECTARRQRSNTALAALTMLNDPIFVEAARCFAARILQEAKPDDPTRLDFAFREAVSRSPDADERKLFLELLSESRDYYDQAQTAGEQLVQIGNAATVADLPTADWAAWTIVARTILNLSESTTRN